MLPFVGFALLFGSSLALLLVWGEKLWHRATGCVAPVQQLLYHMRVDRADGSTMHFHLRKEPKNLWVRESGVRLEE